MVTTERSVEVNKDCKDKKIPQFGDPVNHEIPPDKLALIRTIDAFIERAQRLRNGLIDSNGTPINVIAISEVMREGWFNVQLLINSTPSLREIAERPNRTEGPLENH